MNYTVEQLETFADPVEEEALPFSPYTSETPGIVKYGVCFRVQNQEQADECLLKIAAYFLRFTDREIRGENGQVTGWRRLSWKEAICEAREGIAVYALAHDLDPLYRMERGVKIENTHWRDLAWKWYRARLPVGMRSADIPALREEAKNDWIAKAHVRGETRAKARGEVYLTRRQEISRKNVEAALAQVSLFESK